ncbi:hypothetical protein N0V90_012622 [Kalmusia sp. IMI 367209]|nr:hypothetical protein N0V90_012622 [Kalmusia sp. IMI 367209]
MPLPPRPSGPIPPSDLLWRHELQQHNAALLERMYTLEAKFKEQEQRTRKAEEAAAICTAMAEDIENAKIGVDRLESKQQEFISTVQKRLIEVDKDMGDFRKTQERVQKLMTSYRELNSTVGDLLLLGTRVDDLERELHGVKNNVGRRHVHEIENIDARLETLELQRSREGFKFRSFLGEFAQKFEEKMQALQAEVTNLTEAQKTLPVIEPYIQVPRSPEAGPSPLDVMGSTSHQSDHRSEAQNEARLFSRQQMQMVHRELDTQGTTQTTIQAEEIEDLDLNAPMVPKISPSNREAPQLGASPRKKLRLTMPTAQRRNRKPQPSITSTTAPEPRPTKIVRLILNKNKKRPGSPISAPKPINEHPTVSTLAQQVGKGQVNPRKRREKKPQPLQVPEPVRKSRRRAAQGTMYELDWNETQRPQPIVGPAYDTPATVLKPLKTKPRRMPPVPEEQHAQQGPGHIDFKQFLSGQNLFRAEL